MEVVIMLVISFLVGAITFFSVYDWTHNIYTAVMMLTAGVLLTYNLLKEIERNWGLIEKILIIFS